MQTIKPKILSKINNEPEDSRIGVSRHTSLRYNLRSPWEKRLTPIRSIFRETISPKIIKIQSENLNSSTEPNIPEPSINRNHTHAMVMKNVLLVFVVSFIYMPVLLTPKLRRGKRASVSPSILQRLVRLQAISTLYF